MSKRRLLGMLILLLSIMLTACGSDAAQATTCGAQFCVTNVQITRPNDTTITLLFQLTDRDGSVEQANPPTFTEGLSVAIDDLGAADSDDAVQNSVSRLLQSTHFAPDNFQCLAGTNIPGAEGSFASACLLTLDIGYLSAMPASGTDVLLTFFSETFPAVSVSLQIP